jgi:hypothetical protein
MDFAVKCLVVLWCAAVFAADAPATRPVAFKMGPEGNAFTPWGFNYDRDFKMRLLEEYWETEWETVEQDFREMKELGANVVRIHLQFHRFIQAPGVPNEKSLAQLTRLLKLAEEVALYLDITGLGCYRKTEVPAWFDQLGEQERWNQQALFWEAIARTCANSPAVFCYDLINEPVIPEQKVETWLVPHELAGFSYLQHIAKDLAGRKREQVGRAWVRQMVQAIRKHDPQRLITLGMLPFGGGGAGFAPADMARELNFLCVHIYPASGKFDESLKLVSEFASHGKPVVIEEIFPINCSSEELEQFIRQSKSHGCSGWISFYWGRKPDELKASKEISDAITLSWLERFSKLGSVITAEPTR